MVRVLKLGLAGLILVAPSLPGQERVPSAVVHSAPMPIPFRPGATDSSASAAMPPGLIDGEGMSKTERIVMFTLVGGLVGGAIAYYTAADPASCFSCEDNREPRTIKGALIGGSIGLTCGVIVTLGDIKPKLALRRTRPTVR